MLLKKNHLRHVALKHLLAALNFSTSTSTCGQHTNQITHANSDKY